jgi:hypothetical protein
MEVKVRTFGIIMAVIVAIVVIGGGGFYLGQNSFGLPQRTAPLVALLNENNQLVIVSNSDTSITVNSIRLNDRDNNCVARQARLNWGWGRTSWGNMNYAPGQERMLPVTLSRGDFLTLIKSGMGNQGWCGGIIVKATVETERGVFVLHPEVERLRS